MRIQSAPNPRSLRHLAWGQGVVTGLAATALVLSVTGPVEAEVPVLGVAVLLAVIGLPRWWRLLGQPGSPDTSTSADDAASHAERKRRIQAVLNAGDTLSMVFQPVIDLRSHQPVGWEALARFDGDDRSPHLWFDEARAVGLAVELELLAVSRALESAPGDEYLAINVGPATLLDDRFAQLVERSNHTRVVVELTEHAVIDDYPAVVEAMTGLRKLGVRMAVDDAGSGFSSLRHVIALAPDIIKLDQTLIASIDRDPRRRTLATSLATFASEIGSELIAEGIEREEELRVCGEIGIRYGQGFLLGKPCPHARAERAAHRHGEDSDG